MSTPEIQALRHLATELELLENLKRIEKCGDDMSKVCAISDQYDRIYEARLALAKVQVML